jgi:hypothetical protein
MLWKIVLLPHLEKSNSRNLGFLNRNRYLFFQVAPKLYLWGRVDPVPDPQLLRKSGRAGNRIQTSDL